MKRLRIFFAILLLALALPFWRFADLVAIISPFESPLIFCLTAWFAIFICIPGKLIFPRVKIYVVIISIFLFGWSCYFSSSLSKFSTRDPEFNHCGRMTFTGAVYPLRFILSEAHRDDLEARNQACWIRKMISRVPLRFDTTEEVKSYSDLMQKRLLSPEIKYKTSLPMIAALYFRINTSSMVSVKEIYDSLHFWIDHYTYEISAKDYSFWSWPHSSYIKWEYGLIERNWQDLIDSIVLEEQ